MLLEVAPDPRDEVGEESHGDRSLEAAGRGRGHFRAWGEAPFRWSGEVAFGKAGVGSPRMVQVPARSRAVSSSGAFRGLETHELFEAGDLAALAEKAASVQNGYTPPGG